MKQTLIFDVKRYAINDGPGVRITIFLKGCHLTCDWCHNPESQSAYTQKMYTESKCIGCHQCVDACPQDACTLTPKGIVTDPEACLLCGTCAEVCPTKATEMSGEEMSVEHIMEMIKKETLLMDQSAGGVTFSGGEPLMHYEFLLQLLEECGKEGIHRCVDTTGFAAAEVLMKVAKKTEYFLYDLKMMDSAKHKKYTGVANEGILKNLQTLAASGAEINIRIPLIKGVNDDEENIQQSAAFIASLAGDKKQVNILPYHNIAAKKYEKLGQIYNQGIMAEPDEDRQQYVLEVFESYGLKVIVGG
jgi:pyruvate formate lyase activating enzyme